MGSYSQADCFLACVWHQSNELLFLALGIEFFDWPLEGAAALSGNGAAQEKAVFAISVVLRQSANDAEAQLVVKALGLGVGAAHVERDGIAFEAVHHRAADAVAAMGLADSDVSDVQAVAADFTDAFEQHVADDLTTNRGDGGAGVGLADEVDELVDRPGVVEAFAFDVEHLGKVFAPISLPQMRQEIGIGMNDLLINALAIALVDRLVLHGLGHGDSRFAVDTKCVARK